MGYLRIIIADDHAVVRKGTIQILEKIPDFKVVGEASNGEEAVQLVNSLEARCCHTRCLNARDGRHSRHQKDQIVQSGCGGPDFVRLR